jgi:hypothetical protein
LNSGNGDLNGPYEANVYASTTRSLDSSSILLGSIKEKRSLPAGASITADIPLTIPAGTPSGQYHLILAAGPRHGVAFVSSQRRTFAIAGADLAQADEPFIARPDIATSPPAGTFSTGPAAPASADAWAFDQPLDTLAGG